MLGLLLSQTGLVPQAPPTGYVASVQPSAVVAFRGATSAVPRSALSSTASIFPAQLIADGDVPMSKAKAKIVAAKAEADAKVAARGYTNPEAKESSVKDFIPVKEDSKLSKEQKLIAEAKAIKAKRIAIVGEPSITGEKVKISKSQSALVNQYTTMEKKLKAQARAAREEQAELDAAAASNDKPSIELPGGFKIGF